jgi:signal transduction histidine kinase
VQEIITNALKHATASNLWIQLSQDPHGMTLRAWDDGRGAREFQAGAGLTGMRERFEQLGGRVETASRADHGFEVQAFMPVVKAPA